MKISSFAWGFVALIIAAIIVMGINSALYLFHFKLAGLGICTLILAAAAVPYVVWAWKKTPLYDPKKKEGKE